MVTGQHSTTGHPILVGGPQISYFFPGLVLEMDMHAPGLHWRGATSAPFPGYLLIGRTPGFSTTLTSASSDIIDQYAETLCGGSDQKYMYKGKCRDMGHFNAGTLNGDPVNFLTTVHGPVQGYAQGQRAHGRDLAEALQLPQGRARPALLPSPVRRPGEEPEDLLQGRLADAADLQLLLHRQQAHRRVHERPRPIRPSNVDPGLPTKGTGKYEWRGFLPAMAHIHGKDNKQGFMTNWNNGAARGFGAADDEWNRNGSVGRDQPPQLQPEEAEEEGQVVPGHDRLRDERRRHPGRARDRDAAAARQAAAGHDRALAAWRSRCST